MHDLKFLRQNRELVETGVALKGMTVDLSKFYALEERRLGALHQSEELKARRNAASEEIAKKKRSGENADAEITAMREVGDRIKALDAELKRLEEESETLASWIPNLPHESVPPGSGPEQNRVVRTWKEPPNLGFKPRPHWELATALGLLDFERAPKIAGSGFLLFTGRGARLERALISFMLDFHTQHHGYTEMSTPHLVRRAALFGTGCPSWKATCLTWGGRDLFTVAGAGDEHLPTKLEAGKLPFLTALRLPTARGGTRRGRGTRCTSSTGCCRQDRSARDQLRRTREARARRVGHFSARAALSRDALCSSTRARRGEVLRFRGLAPGTGARAESSSRSNFEDFRRGAWARIRPEAGAKAEIPHTLNARARPAHLAACSESSDRERGRKIPARCGPSCLRAEPGGVMR
jgi:seryl-tRNA synthetase